MWRFNKHFREHTLQNGMVSGDSGKQFGINDFSNWETSSYWINKICAVLILTIVIVFAEEVYLDTTIIQSFAGVTCRAIAADIFLFGVFLPNPILR